MPQKRKQRRSYKKPTESINPTLFSVVLEKKLDINGDIFFKLSENGKYKKIMAPDAGHYFFNHPKILENIYKKNIKKDVNVKSIDSIDYIREQREKETNDKFDKRRDIAKEARKAKVTPQYVYAMEITLSWPRHHWNAGKIILYKQGRSTGPDFRKICLEENWKIRRSDPEMNISFKIIAKEKISKSKEDGVSNNLDDAILLEKKLLDLSEESKLSLGFWHKHFNIKPLTPVQLTELEKNMETKFKELGKSEKAGVWYIENSKKNKSQWPDGFTEVRNTLDYPSVNTWLDKNKIGDS